MGVCDNDDVKGGTSVEVTLDFIARQLQKVIDEQRQLRFEVAALRAGYHELAGDVADIKVSLHSFQQSWQNMHSRLTILEQ